jgi:ABC-type transport system substrate-binding protein
MNRLDRFAATILVAALIVVAGAMAAPRSDQGRPSATPAATQIPYREGILGHPSSITPLTARTQVDRDLVSLLFRGLVKEGAEATVVADLASTWSISADGKSYTFSLQEAYWEDGTQVTSGDVVFTLGLIQSTGGPLAASWYGIHAVAESTRVVRFDLPTPFGGFLRQACLPLLPEHVLRDVPASELADSDFSANPVGDGAFQLLAVDASHAVLQRSQAGSVAAETASAADSAEATSQPSSGGLGQVELLFFDDPAEMAAAFEAGRLDAVGGLGAGLTRSAAASAGARIVTYPWAMLTGVVLNQRASHAELRDVKVRLSLLGAVDRVALVDAVFGDQGMVADGLFPAWSEYCDPSVVTRVPFDRVAARTRLASAGWTESAAGWAPPKYVGPYSIKLLTPDEATNSSLYRAAVAVTADWRSLNIDAEVEVVSATDYLTRLKGGDFTAAVADFQLGLDPDFTPLLASSMTGSGGTNVSGYQDSALDRLMAAVRTTTDPAARAKAVLAVEKHLDTTIPILPLSIRDYQLVVSSRVDGPTPNHLADPSGRYWDVIDWRLASDG